MSNGQRPSASLLRDPYAGHRDYEDFYWTPDPVRDTQWTDWDYALMEAVTAIDSLTNSQTGQYRWLSEDPDVYWEVGESVDYGVQQLVKETEKYKDGVPQELTLYLKNPTKNGDFWTVEDWLKHKEEESARLDRGAPEGARPPTSAERAARKKAQQERIAAALADDPPIELGE